MDRIGNGSQTYKKKMKKMARINTTPQVIRACICMIRSILQVTQRVPPTCTIKTSRTRLYTRTNVREIGLDDTCWWHSLCNLEYWSNCTKTCLYNLGCWIYTSNFFYIFLVCLTDITNTIKCSLFFNVWLYQVREVFYDTWCIVLVVQLSVPTIIWAIQARISLWVLNPCILI